MLVFPLSVQAQVSYPTQESVLEALKDAEYGVRRFEDVTGRVDFDRWRLPDINRERKIKQIRHDGVDVEGAKTLITRLERSREPIAGFDLLIVYDTLGRSGLTLDDLGNGTMNFQDAHTTDMGMAYEAGELAMDLERASEAALSSQAKLHAILQKQLLAQETELRACRKKSR